MAYTIVLSAACERTVVLGAELPALLSDGLVGDDDTSLRQEFLHIAEAQGESMVQPHAVAVEKETNS